MINPLQNLLNHLCFLSFAEEYNARVVKDMFCRSSPFDIHLLKDRLRPYLILANEKNSELNV